MPPHVDVMCLLYTIAAFCNSASAVFCIPGTHSFDDVTCQSLAAGYYASGTAAGDDAGMCGQGTWSAAGASACTWCPAGFTSPYLSTSIAACTVIPTCAAGHSLIQTDITYACVACSAGTYMPSLLNSFPLNVWHRDNLCKNIGGSRPDLADVSIYIVASSTWPSLLKYNGFPYYTCKNSANPYVLYWDTNTMQWVAASSLGAATIIRAVSTESSRNGLLDHAYMYTFSECMLCQGYNTASAQTQCTTCGVGLYNTAPISSAAACIGCAAGYYLNNINYCEYCTPGYYNTASGQTNCTYCAAEASVYGVAQTVCLLCSRGKFKYINTQTAASSCLNCPFFTYSTMVGATSSSDCAPCIAGQYADPLKGGCPVCEAGSYQSSSAGATVCTGCERGTYGTALMESSACTPCPAGYSTNATGLTACSQCPQATYATPGMTACTPCPAGTYGHAPGIGACTTCTRGSYSSSTGKQACTPCDFGLYTTATRATTCASCAAGTYAYVTGSTTCTPCPNGTGSFPAARACVTCI